MVVPEYFIFTDIGHDIDDALAFTILAPLHKAGKIKIAGIVVQLAPTDKRVTLMLGLLAALGVTDVPVAHGPAGEEPPWKLQPYEFDEGLQSLAPRNQNMGDGFLKLAEERLVTKKGKSRGKDEKVRVLVLTNFQRFVQVVNHVGEDAVKAAVSEIHVQSGLDAKKPGWNINEDAGNNKQHLPSAKWFFEWSAKEKRIPFYIYTNQSALPARFSQQEFYKIIQFQDRTKPGSGNMAKVRNYLRNVHETQCENYYIDSNRMVNGVNVPVIEGRGRDWYFKTYLPKIYKKQDGGGPKMEGGKPFYDKEYPLATTDYIQQLYQFAEVIPYDPLVALGSVREVTGFSPDAKKLGDEKHEIGSNVKFESKEARDISNNVKTYLGNAFK
ncbi:hypothetical protein K491DRAFT_228891 [Lophiostoma macrostomum CBS 122681]|uniref:Inosine/uridine-preferring nucleoside hydrolase domain-containing protein n=1 Tax=Lophiostoma macrostomum CBS 122681 TaxID=1314788 RepID=A0A6A6SR12_9PLEO|nr:hypothetical protein K491DRAFT_228891 [Lophiostoma macrostomum CBS 122681]